MEYLEQAEIKAGKKEKDLKGSLGRCRDSLEQLVALILKKEFNEESVRRFYKDLVNLESKGVLDKGTIKLIYGVYGYVSEKGAHRYETETRKLTTRDVEYGLNQTYTAIDILLTKYLEFKKGK